jgi:hypothetical protein
MTEEDLVVCSGHRYCKAPRGCKRFHEHKRNSHKSNGSKPDNCGESYCCNIQERVECVESKHKRHGAEVEKKEREVKL